MTLSKAQFDQFVENYVIDIVKGLDIDLGEVDAELFIDKEENKFVQKENKAVKAIDKGIDMQIFVLNVKSQDWRKLYDYHVFDKAISRLSSMQLGILQSMANGLISIPSEKQSIVLYKIYELAEKEGFII